MLARLPERLQFAVDTVDLPDAQAECAASDELVAVVVEKDTHSVWSLVAGLPQMAVPDSTSQITRLLSSCLVARIARSAEGQALHLDLVQVEAVHDLTGLEVPMMASAWNPCRSPGRAHSGRWATQRCRTRRRVAA